MFNKKIVLIIIFVIGLFAISAVSATEDSQNQTVADDNANQKEVVKSVSLTPTKLSTSYASGKYFKVKAIDAKTKKPASDVKLLLKVYTGKKFKKVSLSTDSKGIAKYSASKLSVGKHKIIVNVKDTKKLLQNQKPVPLRFQRPS